MRFLVRPSGPLQGTVRVPGDKSIAHRWLLLAATAAGASEIHGLPQADDLRSTATCALRLAAPQPGLEAWLGGEQGPVRIEGRGFEGLTQPQWPLDCGNSGTTMRLLLGLLAGRSFGCALEGDESLSRRPMERVAEPLRAMGAQVDTEGGHAPVQVVGGDLRGITFEPPVPSAQLKSAVLLAGLQAEGETVVDESRFLRAQPGDGVAAPTREHTETALLALEAPITSKHGVVTVSRSQHGGFRAVVPGDVSSAAFLAAAGRIVPGSDIEIPAVGLHPSRTSFLGLLPGSRDEVGDHATLAEVEPKGGSLGEPAGRLGVSFPDDRSPLHVPAWRLPLVIDEVPALAALACHLEGESRFEGAGELRVKESDRLEGLVLGIRGLGGTAEIQGDDLIVAGGGLPGGEADSQGDHRLAMALAVAALGGGRESVIHGAEASAVSFPGFAATLRDLGGDVEVAG